MWIFLKIGLTGLISVIGWALFNDLGMWLLNQPNDLSLLVGLAVCFIMGVLWVTAVERIWRRELQRCAEYLGL
jgi:hypothetical protein